MAIWTRQVNELEEAKRLSLLRQHREVTEALVVHGDHLAGVNFADEARADDVQCARFGRNYRPCAVERRQAEGPDAVRIAKSEELSRGEHDDGVRPLNPGHRRLDRLEDVA